MKAYHYRLLNILLCIFAFAPYHWFIHYNQLHMTGKVYLVCSVISAFVKHRQTFSPIRLYLISPDYNSENCGLCLY